MVEVDLSLLGCAHLVPSGQVLWLVEYCPRHETLFVHFCFTDDARVGDGSCWTHGLVNLISAEHRWKRPRTSADLRWLTFGGNAVRSRGATYAHGWKTSIAVHNTPSWGSNKGGGGPSIVHCGSSRTLPLCRPQIMINIVDSASSGSPFLPAFW